MTGLPIVHLQGSEEWEGAHDWGNRLDDVSPGQDATDFAYACTYNQVPDSAAGDMKSGIEGLQMVTKGAPDGPNWLWVVTFNTGAKWAVIGGCDYTGWDCQSHTDWSRLSFEGNW